MIQNQLTLGVGFKDEASFANYYIGKNQQLVEELQKSAGCEDGERVLYVSGMSGDGRTHLLQACCHEANQKGKRSVYLPLSHLIEFSPDIFEGLEVIDLVCVDDVHKIAGKSVWEEAFFHAYNRIRDAGGRLIFTANVMPKCLGLTLPDVESRLAWGMIFQLHPLTDEEKLMILISRALRRGMTLSEEVGKFILTHCSRHMSTLFATLDALDNRSLAAQRKLTIPFVKAVLNI